MQFLPATCPTCSGKLQLPNDKTNVKCMYCGNDVLVQKAVQAYSGVNLDGYAKLARSAAKGGNYSEAYSYYTKILEVDPENLEAWLGKADSAGWMSTLRDFRIAEMISGFEHAVEIAGETDKTRVRKQAS